MQHPQGKPTVKQVYAIARALCEQAGEPWPATREEASTLIHRLRGQGSSLPASDSVQEAHTGFEPVPPP